MAKHRTRVGIHARNSVHFTVHDYQLMQLARIETIKMMSHTDIGVYQRLRKERPSIEFIVRLYDDRLRYDSRPSPTAFVSKMVPIIDGLKRYAVKFEIHNEPNHAEGVEGWGSSDQHARSFRDWYMQVLPALKEACPWASFGFPGLALNHPHRDLEWLEICSNAVQASHWLGCHCYWQYNNMLKDQWGLRFKLYHERFPNKQIEITEFGDSTPDRRREDIAELYVQYYQELNKYPYLRSASAFIASSPDPSWSPFVWMKEGGEMLPVVRAVGAMKRVAVETTPAPQPATPTQPSGRTFSQTGKTVDGAFLEFFDQYGLDICGYPITNQIEEGGKPAQYFQRIALEETEPGKVRLKLVGAEAWSSRSKVSELEARIAELRKYPVGAGAATKPPVDNITDTLPKHATDRYPTRALTDIGQIVIHHTGTSPTITPERLAQYQVENQKKPGITYHYVISADGVIYQTNELETVSDHAYARNRDSVGVCFTGNFGDTIPPAAQLEAGGWLCAWLLTHLRLSTDKIVGLGEFVNTQSPGKQWLRGERWKDKLLAKVQAIIETSGESQAGLVASLQEQIRTLQEEIEVLRLATPGTAGSARALAQVIVDKLSSLLGSMQGQTNTLQGELSHLETALKAESTDQSDRIAALTQQVNKLRKEKTELQSEMETALKAKGDEQSKLIASLRARINTLQDQIRKLGEQPTTPGTAPDEIAMPIIQNMIDKLPTHETNQYNSRKRSDIQTLVIHHSAVPPTVGPKRIAEYHVNNLDWPGVGYHFLVAEDGVIYQGNALTTVSHHAAKVNPRGVGICFLGNFNKTVPPPEQLRAGAHLVAWLIKDLDLELDLVKGHQEFMSTACPGNQWLRGKKWKQMLRQEIVNLQQGVTQPGTPIASLPGVKPIYHYMLFWHHGDSWALRDWVNAQDYVAAYQPSIGFSSRDAAQAQYVTIVGGPLGVPKNVEDWLIAQGCKVDRIAGKDEAATKHMLSTLIDSGKRFWSFDE